MSQVEGMFIDSVEQEYENWIRYSVNKYAYILAVISLFVSCMSWWLNFKLATKALDTLMICFQASSLRLRGNKLSQEGWKGLCD